MPNYTIKKTPRMSYVLHEYKCNYCDLKIETKSPLEVTNLLQLTIHSDNCESQHTRERYEKEMEAETRRRELLDACDRCAEAGRCTIM
jgi:hypothetical protein